MNAVELCNLALGRIGQGAGNPIQSLAESSEQARACNRVFAITLQAVLREGVDWPFARAVVALQPVAQTVPGWTYVYAYPNNALRIQALSDADTDPFRGMTPASRVRFKLLSATNGESLVIATDLDDAWAWYTLDVTRPEFGDALFQDALAWRLALELALGLKVDPRMAQTASQSYQAALAKAGAAAANEQVPDAEPDAESIRVRE